MKVFLQMKRVFLPYIILFPHAEEPAKPASRSMLYRSEFTLLGLPVAQALEPCAYRRALKSIYGMIPVSASINSDNIRRAWSGALSMLMSTRGVSAWSSKATC